MINRESIATEWREKVVPGYKVPNDLFEHQIDAMALLKEGKHVLLGNPVITLYLRIWDTGRIARYEVRLIRQCSLFHL